MSNLYNLFKTVGEVYKFVDCNSKQQAINLSKNNPILIAIYNNTMYYKGKVLTFKRQCAPKENKLIVCKSLPYNLQKGNNYYFNKTVSVNVTKLNAEEIKSIHKYIVDTYNKLNENGDYDNLELDYSINLSLYLHDKYNRSFPVNLYTSIDTFDDNELNNFINEHHPQRYTLICRFQFYTLCNTTFPIIIHIKNNTTLKNLNNINIAFPWDAGRNTKYLVSKQDMYIENNVVRARFPMFSHYCLYYRKVRRYFKGKEGNGPKHKLKLVRSEDYTEAKVSYSIRKNHPNTICYCYYKGRNNKRCLFPKIFLAKHANLYI